MLGLFIRIDLVCLTWNMCGYSQLIRYALLQVVCLLYNCSMIISDVCLSLFEEYSLSQFGVHKFTDTADAVFQPFTLDRHVQDRA